MTTEQILRASFIAVVADKNFTEAVMRLSDESGLCFCHRVDERWAKAIGPEDKEDEAGLAGQLLRAITIFRLNAKHPDIQFEDGSRWDEAFQVRNRDS